MIISLLKIIMRRSSVYGLVALNWPCYTGILHVVEICQHPRVVSQGFMGFVSDPPEEESPAPSLKHIHTHASC
jgi:hypothetical protein